MKHIKLLLVAIFSLLTFSGFSQWTDKTSLIEVGEWNKYSQQWTWKKQINIDLTITVNNTKIYINDVANTVISVYGESTTTTSYNDEGSSYSSTSWDAFDEKNRKCMLMMTYFKDKNLILYNVMYSSVAFRYYCPQNNNL